MEILRSLYLSSMADTFFFTDSVIPSFSIFSSLVFLVLDLSTLNVLSILIDWLPLSEVPVAGTFASVNGIAFA